jgi:uncharacterized protein
MENDMENMATIERVYAAFARGDMDTIMAAMAPDVTVKQDAPLPWGGTYTGHAGFGRFLGTLLEHLDVSLETDELISSGDYVVQIGRTRGTVRRNGKPFRVRELHIWRFEDGMVASYQVHIDLPHMLNALA